MAADFLTALIEHWAAQPELVAAGVGTLYRDTAAGTPSYPYAVATYVGGKRGLENFGKGSMREDVYRVNLFATTNPAAGTLGRIATAALEGMIDAPLAFDDGKQVDFAIDGDSLVKLRAAGTGGVPNVWLYSIACRVKVWRVRA